MLGKGSVEQYGRSVNSRAENVTGDICHPTELALESWSAGQDPLSDRERQVLRLAGEGKTGAEIARLVHLSKAISKLGAGNRIEAYRMARNAGWL